MNLNEEIQRNMVLIEYYKEQLATLEYQTQLTQAALTDYHKAKITLNQLGKNKQASDVLIPVGGGIFLNSTLQDTTKVLIDIGAGYITEKTPEDAITKLEERIKNMQENQEKLLETAQQLQNEANELSEKTQKLMNQNQK